MGLTLREQLSTLSIPRLSTVLRVDLMLRESDSAVEQAERIITGWWNRKAAPYDTEIVAGQSDLSFARDRFKLEFARTYDALSLAMEEPDSSAEFRTWICETSLQRVGAGARLSLRLSFRQPNDIPLQPLHRAPRLLREIVDSVGTVDLEVLETMPRTYHEEDLDGLMYLLEQPDRMLPVVVVSEDPDSGDVYADPDRLARELAGTAHVVRIDGDAAWALSKVWGKEWSTYLGGVRCYNSGFDRSGDKMHHKLWLAETIQRADAAYRDGFLNQCTGHIFRLVTAQFEASPLLSPETLRRELETLNRQFADAAVWAPLPEIVPALDMGLTSEAVAVGALRPEQDESELTTGLLKMLREENTGLQERISKYEKEIDSLRATLEQERVGRSRSETALTQAEEERDLYKCEFDELQEKLTIAKDSEREPSASLRPLRKAFNDLSRELDTMAVKFRRIEQEAQRAEQVDDILKDYKRQVSDLQATSDSVSRRQVEGAAVAGQHLSLEGHSRILPRFAEKVPVLEAALVILEALFPDRIVVLESAYKSARSAEDFRHRDDAFALLWKLSTEYWLEIQKGGGDAAARKIFGVSYATNEGSVLPKAGRKRRTFDFEGGPLFMEKHLKMGVKWSDAETLRIHFEWVAAKKLIVIGHCGGHLDRD